MWTASLFLLVLMVGRELEIQVDQARRRNQRAEGVVAQAAHLLPQMDGM